MIGHRGSYAGLQHYGAATNITRDVSGSGGYIYRQKYDGTITILSGPTGVGTVLAVDPNIAAWMAITNEIGTYPGNDSLASAFATWKTQFGVSQPTGTAASTTTAQTVGTADVGEAATRGDRLGGILASLASIFGSGASIAQSVASARGGGSSDYVDVNTPYVPAPTTTTTSSAGWMIGGGVLLVGVLAFLAVAFGKKKSPRTRPKRQVAR